MKITAQTTYGNTKTNLDDWQKTANPWTVILKNGKKRLTVPFFTGQGLTSEPSADSVLWCIVSDANLGEYDFNWFCDTLGYDSDSRTAEKIHRECQTWRKKLKRFLGDSFDQVMGMEEEDINLICE